MAEIRVERKGGRNIWPLIIGVLVVLAILWFVMGRNRGATTAGATGAGQTSLAPSALVHHALVHHALAAERSTPEALGARALVIGRSWA